MMSGLKMVCNHNYHKISTSEYDKYLKSPLTDEAKNLIAIKRCVSCGKVTLDYKDYHMLYSLGVQRKIYKGVQHE